MKYFYFLISYLLFHHLGAQNQVNCSNALYEANRLYEGGKIQDAITLLEPCAQKSGFEKNEKTEAYRLLALCYLNSSNESKVDFYTTKMLKSKPDYKDFPNIDPAEFRQLLGKYEVHNKIELGILAGANYNQIRVIKNYSTNYSPSFYSPLLGYLMGGLLEFKVKKKISIILEPQFYTFNYKRELENVGGWKQSYKENMLCIGIPVSLHYYFQVKNTKLFVIGGLQDNFMINSYGNILSTNISDNSSIQNSTKTTQFRRTSWFSGKLGMGYIKKVGAGYFTVRAEFNYAFSNIMLSEKRYDNIPFLLSTQYIDPDFSPAYASITFGYQFPIKYSVIKSK